MYRTIGIIFMFLYMGVPLIGVGCLIACGVLLWKHKRYLASTQDDPPRQGRRIWAVNLGLLGGVILLVSFTVGFNPLLLFR